jgi:hypothetical protein
MVRIMFGAMSTMADVDAMVDIVAESIVDKVKTRWNADLPPICRGACLYIASRCSPRHYVKSES